MNLPVLPTPAIDDSSLEFCSFEPDSGTRELAEVYIYVGLEFAAKYEIPHGEYLIGRDVTCHLAIDADGVSRHHARLSFNAYEVVVEDLESANGVFIEGVQVQLPTRVRPDQEVQIGRGRLYVRLSGPTSRRYADALWDADLGLGPVREQLQGERYKPLTTVAKGGMGVILQARDLRLRRTVAMKVMKTGAQFSRENVMRFIDEAQLTGQLEHPNIIPVYELGIDAHGETFYTMKFVKGITLDEVIYGLRNRDRLMMERYNLGALLTIFQKICDAVAFAHSKGIVHRDLKPENVMIGEYGEVLVMDWGLAKKVSKGEVELEMDHAPVPLMKMRGDRGFETMNGVVVGTPPYVSPEQAKGELESVDRRSDVYVLGGILYSILTLRPPVKGQNVQEVLDKIIAGEIVPPTAFNRRRRKADSATGEPILLTHCPASRVPDGLAAVVMKALRVDPAARYQRVEEIQADIAAYQGGFATRAENAGTWRQMVLFAGRHRREVSLMFIFALVLQVVLVAFIVELSREKSNALQSAERAGESESSLARVLAELRGTAPTFAQEAASLLVQQKPEEALEKIEYAIAQVPNEGSYHALRGNILQTLLRLEAAVPAYEEALRRNPNHRSARENLKLTQHLIAGMSHDGMLTPALLRELHTAMMRQKRVGEAQIVLEHIGKDRRLFFTKWKAAFENQGLGERFETKEDETIHVDLSKIQSPNLWNLRDAPVSSLNLDDTRITDIGALRGMSLVWLSLNRTQVRGLFPLQGMRLRSLQVDGTSVSSISALAGMPLEQLRLTNTHVESLAPLEGVQIEQLNVSGSRRIKDLTPLAGMPLQNVDLSRTGISDLSPLAYSPIRELNLEGCTDLKDLRPLLEIATLEGVLIPAHCRDIEYLRDHPNLKRLSYKKVTEPVYEFWAEYDKRQKPRPSRR